MNLLVIGATGFTGFYVVQRLANSGHRIRCLVRTAAKRSRVPDSCETISGNLDDVASVDRAMMGMDVLVNIASLGFGHGPVLVERAQAADIRRAVFISTTSVFTQLNAPSKAIRMAAEAAIEASRLDYVILRPTMIYGTVEDRNICRMIRFLSRYSVLPTVGPGTCLQQPVHVGDLADAICAAALGNAGSRSAFNVSGAAPLTFNEMVDTVSALLGKRTFKLRLPIRPTVILLRFFERLGLRFPIKAEQVLRLNEHKAFDHSDAVRTFRFHPRTFQDGVAEEVHSMGLGYSGSAGSFADVPPLGKA
jgi:nucleoside-diphosphate-sugar epimerase